MDRIQEFELWEKNKRREMQYIRTNVSDQPQIFYMPKEHNELTKTKFEASVASIEEEIRIAKSAFEEDLIKIETRINNTGGDEFEDDDEEDDEFEAETKPKSVIVKQPALKRTRENIEGNRNKEGNIKVTIRNSPELKQAPPKRIKDEIPSKRKKSSSSTSDEDSSDSSSDDDDEEPVKVKIEKK